jgi:hypothetical protein
MLITSGSVSKSDTDSVYFCVMKNLIDYTERLLTLHDCAIIPGFGGFIANQLSAHFDADGGIIKAPLKVIYFNATLNHNDGMFAEVIHRSESVSYRKANEMIVKAVDELSGRIKNGETVVFGRLGLLKYNEGVIEFVPASSFGFLPENFGMTDVIHTSTQLPVNMASDRKRFVIKTGRTSLLRYAASGAVILLLMFSAPMVQDKRFENHAKIDFTRIFSSTDQKLSQSLREIKAGTEASAQNNYPSTEQPVQAVGAKSQTLPWHIVIASFASKEEAMAKVKELQHKAEFKSATVAFAPDISFVKSTENTINPQPDITPAPEDASNHWFVVVASFETKKRARSYVEQTQKNNPTQLNIYGDYFYFPIVAGSFSSKEAAVSKVQELRKQESFKSAIVVYSKSLAPAKGIAIASRSAASAPAPAPRPAAPAPTQIASKNVKPAVPAMQKTPAPQPAVQNQNAGPWLIVVANFETLRKAKKFIDNTTAQTKTGLSIYGNYFSFPIVAGAFSSKEAATARLNQLKAVSSFKNAVVLYSPKLKPFTGEMPKNAPAIAQQPGSKNVQRSAAAAPMAKQALAATNGEAYWHIVVGSYSSRENAEKFVRNTHGEGSLTIIPGTALYRVIAGSYDNAATAGSKAKALRGKYSGAWVLYDPKLKI